MAEFWIPMGFVAPAGIAERARQVEADGWDGIKIYDTQCLFADAFVMMTAAGVATERLKISLSTSNPVTRHPAVAASAFAGLAQMIGPRLFYGIGRGDSSLAYIGGAPAPLDMFERYLTAVRRYLAGQNVPFDLISDWQISSPLSSIQLGHAPEESSLRFLRGGDPVVPIEAYATGPKVMAIAGRHADRVALGLGGDIARLRWAIGLARNARVEAGLDPSTLSFSSVVPVGVSRDIGRARRSVANMVASSARFSVINGKLVGPATDSQRRIYENILKVYDMSNHGGSGEQTDLLTDEFIDDFAIVGTPEMCVDRILQLTDAGIDALMLAPPQGDADPQDIADGYNLLIHEVIPAVRERLRR